MKKILLIWIILAACHKDTETNHLTSVTSDDILLKTQQTLPDKKMYVIKNRDTDYAYVHTGTIVRPRCASWTGAQDTMRKILTVLDTIHKSNRHAFSHYPQRVAGVQSGWQRIVSKTVSNDTASPAIIFDYHYTFWHDITWPQTNYRVDVYWNIFNGHISDYTVTTDAWGLGNYNSYTEIHNPNPNIHLDWENGILYWDIEGVTNIGINFSFLGIEKDFRANVPVEFTGWVMFSSTADMAASGASTVLMGMDAIKHKAQTTHPMQ